LKKNSPDTDSTLKLALSLFKKHGTSEDYQHLIEILDNYLDLHPDNLLAQKLIAFSLIETKSFDEAYQYLKRIHQRALNETDILNALAWLGLMEGRTEESINNLLDAIYLDKGNQRLKNNLETLKNIKDPKVFFRMSRPEDFLFVNLPREKLLSTVQNRLRDSFASPLIRSVILIIIVILAGYIIYINYPAIVNLEENYRFKNGLGKGRVTHVAIQDIEKIIDERKQYNIKLSAGDIKKKFQMISDFIEQKKRNQAMMVINELLNSNASEYIKERVLVLKDVMPDIDLNNIDYLPTVQEVNRLPFLYQDVYIRWYGTIANLEHKDRKETVFDLLIDFVENAVVAGIAESHFNGFQNIASGEKVAVIGLVTGITIDNKIIVKGIQIQRLDK
jgi:tetratricopeptide (TPR) repeat protein